MKRTPLTRKTPLKAKTPLKPGKPLQSKASLRRHTPPKPLDPSEWSWNRRKAEQGPKRTKPKRRSPSSNNRIPRGIAKQVDRRANGRCERCGIHTGLERHHRKRKSQGGEHTVENIVAICSRCHHVIIHGNTAWAFRHGWLVRHYANPEHVQPVSGCDIDCPIDHVHPYHTTGDLSSADIHDGDHR